MSRSSTDEFEPRPHEEGFLGTRLGSGVRHLYTTLWHTVVPKIDLETSIFDEEDDWDICIVLDSCRVDALESVAPEFDWLPSRIGSRWSVGSASGEWVARTFDEKYENEISETSVVSTNGWYHRILTQNDFAFVSGSGGHSYDCVPDSAPETIVHAWAADQERGNLHATGGPAPDLMCKYGLYEWKTGVENLLLHFMPPHQPYVGAVVTELDEGAEDSDFTDVERTPFTALSEGADEDEVWEAYLENLRYGLRHVERLLHNLDDVDVLLTADHGELFGEWGLTAHPPATPHPDLRQVPWVYINSQSGSRETLSPERPPDIAYNPDKSDVGEQLEALGYVE